MNLVAFYATAATLMNFFLIYRLLGEEGWSRKAARAIPPKTDHLTVNICPLNANDSSDVSETVPMYSGSDALPLVYMITPTYTRPAQKADLTRLAQTLQHVTSLHWILIEDSPTKSAIVARLLKRYSQNYTHLNIATPADNKHPKGVAQRNLGLDWLHKHFANNRFDNPPNSIVFFGDDDNAYDVRIFDAMRQIRRVGIWPVAFCGGLAIEKPKVQNQTVVGWEVGWSPNRTIATDMAGFAVHIREILSAPEARFEFKSALESVFLTNLNITVDDLEPLAIDEREVLVWHVQTREPLLTREEDFKKTHGYFSYDGWIV